MSDVAVCVHVYYEEAWPDIARRLREVHSPVDLYVTCRAANRAGVEAAVRAGFPDAVIDVFENEGMDVLPFLRQCRQRGLARYRAVLKLHTKNRKSRLRADQGDAVLDGLCGDAMLVGEIAGAFRRDPGLGLVAAAVQVRSADALMYGNRALVRDLLKGVAPGLADWPFPTGTMFWASGGIVEAALRMLPDLERIAAGDGAGRTGGDGASAHAMERVFGALCDVTGTTLHVTDLRGPGAGHVLVPLALHGPLSDRRLLEAGSGILVARHANAGAWCHAVAGSGLFDAARYGAGLGAAAVPGMDPVWHYVAYGDVLGLDPGPGFDARSYRMRCPDAVRRGMCTLVHYLEEGRRRGVPAAPSEGERLRLAQDRGLFDPVRYAALYPDVAQSGLAPERHYRHVGRRLGREASAAFRPALIPAVGARDDRGVVGYMRRHHLDEGASCEAAARAFAQGDLDFAERAAARALERYGPTRAVHEMLAITATLGERWDAARAHWAAFGAAAGAGAIRHADSLVAPGDPFGVAPAVDPGGDAGRPAGDVPPRTCIYVAAFGEAVPAPMPVAEGGIDHVCLTDRPRDVPPGWREVRCDPGQGDPALDALSVRIRPHAHLGGYDRSLYLDPDRLGRWGGLPFRHAALGAFAMPRPPRGDVVAEACAALRAAEGRGADEILGRLEALRAEGLPRGGLVHDDGCIWRRHADPEVARAMDRWWDLARAPGATPRIALAEAIWRGGLRPVAVTDIAGT